MRERRSPTPAAARKRTAIRCLQQALEQERLCLHYQPIVDARAGAVERVEALLRWRCPEAEEESLSDLIWAAERSPVIFRLENWVMGQAFQDAARWPRAGLPALRVNVNLSAREFPRADLVARVSGLLDQARLSPAAVAVEITETSRLSDFPAVAAQIERLREMGLELWLDDFGTGHSSLEWLSHLPLHGLKIAGTFVERLSGEPRCRIIVRRSSWPATSACARSPRAWRRRPSARSWRPAAATSSRASCSSPPCPPTRCPARSRPRCAPSAEVR